MAVPDRKTVAVAVLVVAGVALVLWLMVQNRNRPDRGGPSADGEPPTDEPRVTVAALHRLVADDRETAGRWLGGKTVRVSGAVCLVARVPDGNGTTLVVGLCTVAYQDSATVLGHLADPKDAERLQIHEPAELRGTLELSAGQKGLVTLKDASLVRPGSRSRSLR